MSRYSIIVIANRRKRNKKNKIKNIYSVLPGIAVTERCDCIILFIILLIIVDRTR